MANKNTNGANTNSFKVLTSTPVAVLKAAVKLNFAALSDKAVKDPNVKPIVEQVAYATNHADKATPKDYRDLVKSIQKALGVEFIVPPTDAKQAEKVLTDPAPAPEAEKPKDTKSDEKLDKPDTADTKDESAKDPKSDWIEGIFPPTLTVEEGEDEIKYRLCKPVGLEVINNDEEHRYLIAMLWTASQLKQFADSRVAFRQFFKKGQKRQFPDDLDVAEFVHIEPDNCVGIALSIYDAAVYHITPQNMEGDEDRHNILYVGGCEAHLYKEVIPDEDKPAKK